MQDCGNPGLLVHARRYINVDLKRYDLVNVCFRSLARRWVAHKAIDRDVQANPGEYNYASAGVGTSGQLAAELFKLSVGVDLAHVPFGGASPALSSTLGGHTPILFAAVPGLAANIKDGSLRALAVTSDQRTPALPGVPTFAEAGYPGQESVFPLGMLAPARTPRPIIEQWHREIVRILALPEVKERLAAIGFEPVGSSPGEFGAWIRSELPRWAGVIREARIQRIE